MTTLKETYNSLMIQKHSMKEQGASFETLDLLDDAIVAIRKAMESMDNENFEVKTDSMFS